MGEIYGGVMEKLLSSRQIRVEKKCLQLEFRENQNGQFLKIVEEAHGRRNTVIIPSTGLEEFHEALEEVLSGIMT